MSAANDIAATNESVLAKVSELYARKQGNLVSNESVREMNKILSNRLIPSKIILFNRGRFG